MRFILTEEEKIRINLRTINVPIDTVILLFSDIWSELLGGVS